MSSIERRINKYNEKEQLKILIKYNRLANWIKFKNFISKLFKKSWECSQDKDSPS